MVAGSRDNAVVAGVDGSAASLRAVRFAADEARWRRASLRLVHAIEPSPVGARGYADAAGLLARSHAHGKRLLTEAAAAVPGTQVQLAVPAQAPVRALLAESGAARMIVVGATGTGALPAVQLGSVPAKLSAHGHCPVAVVRGEVRDEGPVVAGIDGGPLSEAVIETAFEEAAARGTSLVAAHARSDGDWGADGGQGYCGWEAVVAAERQVLGESLALWREKYPEVGLERLTVRDRPRHLLLEWSRRAQLVVAGSRGRGGFAGLAVGSTCQALVQHADCPVLVVRPRGGFGAGDADEGGVTGR